MSDAGLQTRTTSISKGHGFTMALRYEGLFPSQVGEFLNFFDMIRYDYEAGESAMPFFIPANHPMWRRVLERDYIEPLLAQSSIDLTLWQAIRVSDVKTPLLNVNGFNFGIRNVFA